MKKTIHQWIKDSKNMPSVEEIVDRSYKVGYKLGIAKGFFYTAVIFATTLGSLSYFSAEVNNSQEQNIPGQIKKIPNWPEYRMKEPPKKINDIYPLMHVDNNKFMQDNYIMDNSNKNDS